MKTFILRAEHKALRLAPIRLLVGTATLLMFRLRWLWGRIRFGALVRDRGLGCVCAPDAQLKYPENLHLGNSVIIGSSVTLGAHSSITLGNNVRISKDVIIETAGLNFQTASPPYKHISNPITIEDGVWIGARAIILGGVTLGRNAVVAAGAVVSRSVGPGQIVAGIPARPIPRKQEERTHG